MVLFYAWTNLVLINMVNTKLSHFPSEEADLLIRCSPTMSQELINEIVNKKIFLNVYYIDIPKIDHRKGIIGKIPKVRLLSTKGDIRNYYARFVKYTLREKKYDKLISGGLWNDTIYLLNFLCKINESIEVEYVEEGERSYEGIGALNQVVVVGKWKEKIVQKYNVGMLWKKHRKNITNTIYLYRPERYVNNKIIVKKIPVLSQDNPCYQILNKTIMHLDESHFIWYEKRSVCYFANYLVPNYEDSYDFAYQIIDSIIKIVGEKQVILKPHTSSTAHRLEFADQYSDEIFVDRSVFLFEGMYTKADFTKKILIARTSSALLYPKVMFNQEPFIIFTYRLFNYYHQFGDDLTDNYVKEMKKMYIDKSKVLVPNTLLEFEKMLFTAYNRIIDEKRGTCNLVE